MQHQFDWSGYKNLLCIRLDNLGDVLMTTPALRALKPGRRLTLLTSGAGAAIAPFIREIDEVIVFNPPWTKNAAVQGAEEIDALVHRLREKRFDAAVIFTVYSQNPLPAAMLCYQAGIPQVAGYCRENPYRLITAWVPGREPLFTIKHEVVRQLDLVRALGAAVADEEFSLTVPDEMREAVMHKLTAGRLDPGKPWVVLHPGASEEKRLYPVELLAQAARQLMEQGIQLVLTGMPAEAHLTGRIHAATRQKAVDLTGALTMAEFIALLRQAPLLISNNTGPVHIAAAVKTPVVVLYALTNPQHTPWKVPHKVLPFDVPAELQSRNTIIEYASRQAFREPVGMVQPESIVEAARQLLAGVNTPVETPVLLL